MCKCGGENATKAIDRAEAALPGWRKSTAHRRSEFLLAWKAQIEKNTEDIAKIMTMECGKPLKEARCGRVLFQPPERRHAGLASFAASRFASCGTHCCPNLHCC